MSAVSGLSCVCCVPLTAVGSVEGLGFRGCHAPASCNPTICPFHTLHSQVRLFQSALAQNPQEAELHVALGVLHHLGRWGERGWWGKRGCFWWGNRGSASGRLSPSGSTPVSTPDSAPCIDANPFLFLGSTATPSRRLSARLSCGQGTIAFGINWAPHWPTTQEGDRGRK